TPQLAKTIPIAKIAGGLVALAASIAIAIVTFQPAKTPLGLNGPELAAVDQSTVSTTAENIVDSATDILKKDISPDELIAAAEPNIEVKAPVIATGIAKSVSPNPMPEVDSPSADSIASVAAAPVAAPSMIDKASKMPTEAEAAALLGESNVLTILVKRTEAGRQSRAVREALRGATIEPAQEKALTEGMVNAVSESLSKDDAATSLRTQILYLEVPAKKVDVFFARLLADEEGIESIRLGMVATPSVRRLVQTLSPDGVRAIRHSRTWELRGNAVNQVANGLTANQLMTPIDRQSGLPLTVSALSSGPDVISRLIILVR
ncbi:MAG: hypothetical protein WBD20_17565, partial [Pirellulaceae bacterium]